MAERRKAWGLIALGALAIGLTPTGVAHALPVATSPSSVLVAQVSTASTGTIEWTFLASTNAARTANGLPALEMDSRLVPPARQWSAELLSDNALSHRVNSRLAGEAPSEWEVLGENVGFGPDAAVVHQEFMNSPTHAANILDPRFTSVGMGVVMGPDGRLWITQYFMAAGSPSAPEVDVPPAATSVSADVPATVAVPAGEGPWSPRRGGPRRDTLDAPVTASA